MVQTTWSSWGVEPPFGCAFPAISSRLVLVGELMVYERGVRAKVHGGCTNSCSNSPASDYRAIWPGERVMQHKMSTIMAFAERHEADETDFNRSVDKEVGKRIKRRRQQLRMSQTALGAAVGVSFQQIQKYERGANRVSSSVLYGIAQCLDVVITY